MKISIGKSRKDTHWKPVNYSWEQLCAKLSETRRTSETVADYKAMSKDERSDRKDVGGFVGGVILNGNRKRSNVESRCLITLDADFATKGSWDNATALMDCAMCCYSTHSHTPKAPRLRYIIPLDRMVTPEEYEPIARRVAADIGINQFDITTYDSCRLMYWPSTSEDGEFVFEKQDGAFLSADGTLARYANWRDTTEWPLGESEVEVKIKAAKAQGEPTDKPGMVGIFCRAYDVPAAIDTFLPDVYAPCVEENRYTYTGGSTSAGAVLYQNGKFLYSHHATDPAGEQLCNAFDLVRLHKFGDLDSEAEAGTPVNKLPSYKAMCEFAQSDSTIKHYLVAEGLAKAKDVFSSEELIDVDWTDKLETSKQGGIDATVNNLVIILDNDPNLAGAFAMNAFTNRPSTVKTLPWKRCDDAVNGSPWQDTDMSNLRHYIEATYGIYNQSKLDDALNTVMKRHEFHPVKKYLSTIKWDGVKRGEELFVYYLGAEDNLYTRTVTKKWLTAAVARIMQPGIKFDNLVVLVGDQGIGKSYLGKLLGKGWFSDTFSTVQGKESFEQIKGSWIVEIGELSAMKKADVEAVKMFLSKQEDTYRQAYGRFVSVNKRQCVFYGTTNDDAFLRDYTGNRRFWPIGCDKEKAVYDVFSLTNEDIDQVWAEAVSWYNRGENLYLTPEVYKLAAEEQERYTNQDPKQGLIEEYLDKPLPKNWKDLTKSERRNFVQGFLDVSDSDLGEPRDEVSVVELAYELLGKDILQPWESKELGGILRTLGWVNTGSRKRSVYGQQKMFVRRKKSNAKD